MDLELTGKKAIVTGGSRGIGKQIARILAQEGVDVVIAARDPERLEATAKEITAETSRNIVPLTVDTSDDDSVKVMVKKAAEALGGVDILINGAATVGGIAPPPKLAEITKDAVWADINVKVMGYLRTAQAAAPYMIAQGWGRIVNISGMAARQSGNTIGSMRNVSVAALTKNLADELGEHGINVTVVHPGGTVTERTTPEGLANMAKSNTIHRAVDASDIANVVVFLASPKSVAITGDTIAAGGGVGKAIHY
ncbi:MAG: SDR family oxidoreductase [SAR202 cluster bacterium]|nr:SDR family oxidoreductase [SAR202 cluster bacterium]